MYKENYVYKNLKLVIDERSMQQTGGEPDMVLHDHITDHYIFMDCSIEAHLLEKLML